MFGEMIGEWQALATFIPATATSRRFPRGRNRLVRIRPYELRHTYATLLLAAGENVKVVSERLGHASAALTLDVYSHVVPDMQQGAAERMEKPLSG